MENESKTPDIVIGAIFGACAAVMGAIFGFSYLAISQLTIAICIFPFLGIVIGTVGTSIGKVIGSFINYKWASYGGIISGSLLSFIISAILARGLSG